MLLWKEKNCGKQSGMIPPCSYKNPLLRFINGNKYSGFGIPLIFKCFSLAKVVIFNALMPPISIPSKQVIMIWRSQPPEFFILGMERGGILL
jgi:hypothetical protein